MATSPPAQQRQYSAPCPGCGAPVAFRSAQSTHAVCGYCQSTVVREGGKLSRLGKMAELFDDHSPLQLNAAGKWQGRRFTLVGRLQYQYGEGTWTEWIALFDDGHSAWLSEDNGAYVISERLEEAPKGLPDWQGLKVGQSLTLEGKPCSVASRQTVKLICAQGELPRLPALGAAFEVLELRNDQGEVLSIDTGPTLSGGSTVLSLGRSVVLDDLELSGLRDEAHSADQSAQGFACPNCGSTVQVQLAQSKSITCTSCHSIIDVSQGVGAQLSHALQDEPVAPLIPLGSTGTLQGAAWQVVGFQHRVGQTTDEEDEAFGWDEYLLFNKKRGFVFLVDASDGWSLVHPTTGTPTGQGVNPQFVKYLGTRYGLKDRYDAETTYVAGEFYWRVERGQSTENADYAAGKLLLSQERSTNEVTWSAGNRIDSNQVVQAFGLQGKENLAQRLDATPLADQANWVQRAFFGLVILMVLAFLLLVIYSPSCDPAQQDCSNTANNSSTHTTSSPSYGSRTGGGSWGGSSSGGGHK